MLNTNDINQLKAIVDGGFCSGCGACALTLNTKMHLNSYGEFNPDLDRIKDGNAHLRPELPSVCPFLSPELNEDVLARPLFESDCNFDSQIGFYHSIYAGFVKEGSYRENGTSGGMGTWLGAELLRLGEIDGVIHVKPVNERSDGEPYFAYAISRSVEEVNTGAKTRYHVVEISEVMNIVRESPGRYLFIGVPCFSKAVRRLQRVDPLIAERIKYVASLICGHLKSVHWTLSLAWGAGIHPNDLAAFQYRTKGPDIPARAYVFTATPKNDSPLIKNSASVVGGKFNAGALMLNACDYCDDVVGETADITIGDAWISKYEVDSGGTNLLIIRNSHISQIVANAQNDGRLFLNQVLAEEAAQSQSGGFRHRREGLSYRLEKAKAEGRWTPEKRVKPGDFDISRARKNIYDARIQVAKISRQAFKDSLVANNYDVYLNKMEPLVKKLRFMELRNSFFRSLINRITRIVLKFKRRIFN
ncbi:Coenzyme F420 hydrogenase/dehydrogenase, beta subunit C-terminal domain [Methylomonas sp. SURF-2]|uniref:Coenzyme F420 hydrogenase/dehydrogenase, beta subunit C-terminal domain n=1 Tax=Methylomonas subterranea TaxID=2952225 RepID=A0ABT1TL40_9GAMM|nr:Coenzyme F420 hydrogenase/dehydrogenase, beta subunit C-terminal domain [Methylomonas sp. SURF-2]MCQ8105931.1 Coenzyme F420 hydrogenase/dehydrogenase, beta subunit C-terminal domain [Methylomonas sp. SURF-2]